MGSLHWLESIGFAAGNVFGSQSWTSSGALTPDNVLFTPTMNIPGTAVSISFKMKVAATFTPDFAEHYAVYVYDDAIGPSFDTNIFEETLTSGGVGTAKDITASIPVSFAGKTIGILVRHYDCTNQDVLAVDDFEVSYSTTLSIEDNTIETVRIYPNPLTDFMKIDAQTTINSAEIINQLGQRVMEVKSNNIINNTIDLSTLNKGMYFMILKSKDKTATIKMIKE